MRRGADAAVRSAEEEAATAADSTGFSGSQRTGTAPVTAVGVGGLALTKAADVVTTVVGLRAVAGLTERNPVANAAIAEFGTVPGLVGLGVLTMLPVVLVIEGCFGLSRRVDDVDDASWPGPRAGRLVCYGVGCGCNLVFALNNAVLLLVVGAG